MLVIKEVTARVKAIRMLQKNYCRRDASEKEAGKLSGIEEKLIFRV